MCFLQHFVFFHHVSSLPPWTHVCRVYIDKIALGRALSRQKALRTSLTSTQSQFYFSFFNVRIYFQFHPSLSERRRTLSWKALKRALANESPRASSTYKFETTYPKLWVWHIRITSICYGITHNRNVFSSRFDSGILIPHFISLLLRCQSPSLLRGAMS